MTLIKAFMLGVGIVMTFGVAFAVALIVSVRVVVTFAVAFIVSVRVVVTFVIAFAGSVRMVMSPVVALESFVGIGRCKIGETVSKFPEAARQHVKAPLKLVVETLPLANNTVRTSSDTS